MKKYTFFVFLILSFFTHIPAVTAGEQSKWLVIDGGDETQSKVSVGVKMHYDYEFAKVPLEEEDLSWLIFYEIHNEFAYWQVGGSFTPGPDDDRFEQIITPQINLIVKDRFYRLGIGALISSVSIDGESDWTRVYWQGIFGIGIPLGSRFGIDIYGHYVFESWSKPGEPASEAPDISLMLNFTF